MTKKWYILYKRQDIEEPWVIFDSYEDEKKAKEDYIHCLTLNEKWGSSLGFNDYKLIKGYE